MGRKIPGKKHRGVKDPHQQKLKRQSLVKEKINTKPADLEEDQPLPESLQNILQWQQMNRDGEKKRTRKKGKILIDSRRLEEKEEKLRGMSRPDKPVPAFIQSAGETDRSFLHRIDRMCQEVVDESEFADKRKIDLRTNAVNEEEEEIQTYKKQRASIEEIRDAPVKQKKKKTNADEPQLTKKEKIKLLLAGKKQAKLDKVQEKQDETNRFRDVVAFGDIVHGPPVLTIPIRSQARKAIESKPGKRGLLLQHILEDSETAKPSKKGDSNKNKKRKTRDLPMVDQERMERNRLQAVEAYRKMKKMAAQS